MSQSTPINMIRRNGSQDGGQMSISDMDNMNSMSSDSQLVEDILKEMGDSPGAELQSNINSQALQYAMDSSQVPPTKYSPPQHTNEGMMDYNNYSQKIMMDQNQNGILGQLGFNLGGETLKAKIMKNIKYPALVFVLCFIISLPEFNRFLFSFFPRLLLESGQVSIGGVMLKALVGSILFSIITVFI
jgi:hypothetical protein